MKQSDIFKNAVGKHHPGPEVRRHLETRNYSVYSWLSNDELSSIREMKDGDILGRLRDLLLKDTLFSTGLFFGSIALGLASFQILLGLMGAAVLLISLLYFKTCHDRDSLKLNQNRSLAIAGASNGPIPVLSAGSLMAKPDSVMESQLPPDSTTITAEPGSYCKFIIPLSAAASLPSPSKSVVFSSQESSLADSRYYKQLSAQE